MFKTRCRIPNAYTLDITVYQIHVSLCSYCTTWILISKTLTGTYEVGHTYVCEMCCYRTLDIVIYIVVLFVLLTSTKHIKLCPGRYLQDILISPSRTYPTLRIC